MIRLRQLSNLPAFAACIVAGVGLVLRVTVQDRIRFVATIYYALPLLVVTGLFAVASALFRRGGALRAARRARLASLLCLGWSLCSQYYTATPEATDDATMRVLLWNSARGVFGWEPVADAVSDMNADLVILVEAGPPTGIRKFWESRIPGMTCTPFGNGIVALSRFPLKTIRSGKLGFGGRFSTAEIDIDGIPLSLFAADVHSNPTLSRHFAFTALSQRLSTLPDGPVLLVGDFNTPTDSTYLSELRRDFRNAFEVAGSGLHVTWPVPIPVLALDQIWCNGLIEPLRCELQWTWCSDHRPVVADLRIRRNEVARRERSP